MEKRYFIDQLLSGFDLNASDFGVSAWAEKRQDILAMGSELEYIVEFAEFSVDCYENIASYVPGRLNTTHRNIVLWKHPREPFSAQYWTQAEFAELIRLLKDHGVDRVMVRTFLTFEGGRGSGRFLRSENTTHTEKFEWRRADEMLRRHPEFRDEATHCINWDAPVRPDAMYHMEAGQSCGQWWMRQLVGFLGELGVTALRLGDDSYNSKGRPAGYYGMGKVYDIHQDISRVAASKGIRLLSSLGPYWSFDAWDHDLGVPVEKCSSLAELVLTQPLEGWTDKYGITYPHNGEYFNAGCGNVHSLINSVFAPQARFIRGLDSGDVIENWHPPPEQAVRQAFDALSHYRVADAGLHPVYHGVYHFWSDCLSRPYYRQMAGLLTFVADHPAKKVDGPVLVVTSGKKPHSYIMGDFFESCGYALRRSLASPSLAADPHDALVYYLPRFAGTAPFLDEEPMALADEQTLRAALDSQQTIIVFGGSNEKEILHALGLAACGEGIRPASVRIENREYPWSDRAEATAVAGAAGTAEKYFRRHYLKLRSVGARELATAIIAGGEARTLCSIHRPEGRGLRIFVGGIPEAQTPRLGQQLIAEPCGLPYRVSTTASVSSFSWEDMHGTRFVSLLRYDKWSDHRSTIDISCDHGLEAVLSYGYEYSAGMHTLVPHGWVVFRME